MTIMNPYAAPRSKDVPPQTPRVFTPRAVAANTILLTPIAGVLMAASNWMRCARRGRAAIVLLVYGFPMAALLFARLALSNKSHSLGLSGISFLISIVIAVALYRDQQELWDSHPASDPLVRRGWWIGTLYGIVAILGFAAIAQLAEGFIGAR